ncbi:MAG: hypothetical protein IPH12_16415 [Saprospirales bacterium]|nr:hypothetical protein [Saprospirales bacterium]
MYLKFIKKYCLLAVLLLFTAAFTNCRRTNDNNPALYGKWTGKEWLVFGKPAGRDAARVFFEFTADGNYSAGFGDQTENGSWRTDKDKLYTTAQNRKEIMVKILKLDAQTLLFEMNRSGRQETLELTKKP